jgi:hypothetical protein
MTDKSFATHDPPSPGFGETFVNVTAKPIDKAEETPETRSERTKEEGHICSLEIGAFLEFGI